MNTILEFGELTKKEQFEMAVRRGFNSMKDRKEGSFDLKAFRVVEMTKPTGELSVFSFVWENDGAKWMTNSESFADTLCQQWKAAESLGIPVNGISLRRKSSSGNRTVQLCDVEVELG